MAKIKKIFALIKNVVLTVYSTIKNNNTLAFLAIFLFFFSVFAFVYMNVPTVSSGDDHYFHFRFAEKLLNDGFLNSFYNFKSIYFTKIAQGGEHFIYYNFLFYIVLLPFTYITPLFVAIKLYAVFIIALIGAMLYMFIKKIGIKYPFLCSVLFFTIMGTVSLSRMFLSRPYVFGPVFLLLLILVLYKKKYNWACWITFFYLFWHTATFFVPLIIGLVYFVIYALYNKKYEQKILVCTFGGTLLALVIVNFIDNGFFTYIYDNILSVIKGIVTGNKVNISEGTELYKRNLFDFFSQNLILTILFIASVVFNFFMYFNERRAFDLLTDKVKQKRILAMVLFFTASIFFLAISNVSYRFADFFIFFGWAFVIVVFSEVLSFVQITNMTIKKSLASVVLISVVFLFANNLLQLNDNFSESNRPESFARVGEYLSKNLKEDEIVFNVSWSWFPQLYYYAPKQNYVIGLEPKLTYLYDQKTYWFWFNISRGFVCEIEECKNQINEFIRISKKPELLKVWYKIQGDEMARIITNNFQSHYIVSSINYESLNEILDNNKHFVKVVNDEIYGYLVYKVLD